MGRRQHAIFASSSLTTTAASTGVRPWSLHHRFQRHHQHPHDHPSEIVVTSSSSASTSFEDKNGQSSRVDDADLTEPLRSIHLECDNGCLPKPSPSSAGNSCSDRCTVSVSTSTASIRSLTDEDNCHGEGNALSCSLPSGIASRHVRFGSCQVRSYTQVLGDHPFCSSGCPIQLGWNYVQEAAVSVESYEADHFPFSCVRNNNMNDLRLTPDDRRRILCKEQPLLQHGECGGDSSGDDEGGGGPTAPGGNADEDDDECPYTSDRELTRACRRLNRGRDSYTRKSSRRAHREFFGV